MKESFSKYFQKQDYKEKFFLAFGFDIRKKEDKELLLKIAELSVCIWKEYLGLWRCKTRKDQEKLEAILNNDRAKVYLYYRLARFILSHPRRELHLSLKSKLENFTKNKRLATYMSKYASEILKYLNRPQLLIRQPLLSSYLAYAQGKLMLKSSKKAGKEVAKKLGLKFIAKKLLKKPVATLAKLNIYSLVAIYFYDLLFSLAGKKELDRIINAFLDKEPLD